MTFEEVLLDLAVRGVAADAPDAATRSGTHHGKWKILDYLGITNGKASRTSLYEQASC